MIMHKHKAGWNSKLRQEYWLVLTFFSLPNQINNNNKIKTEINKLLEAFVVAVVYGV